MTSARTPGERAGLTRSKVISAARGLLATGGVSGLSMRSLARRLDVAPNSVYSYFADKAALLEAVLDDLLSEIPLPNAHLPPRDGLRAIMLDSFDALVRHPDLVALSLAIQGSGGTNAWRLGDRMLEQFAEAGIGESDARAGLRILLIHMMGCAAFATQYDPRLGDRPPHTVASVRADYVVALDWLLDGILS